MAKCKNCKVLTFVEAYGEKYPWCDMLDDYPNIEFERDCPKFERMSNADRIRAMSDEELAEWLTKITDDAQRDARTKCDYQWGEFLKSEVKE